ncbi:MAG: hypothetical protein A2017_18725 [Lentisphaerae bacterium GWF2_44_16]|nr:MAG: hypothetical protein A2017_18725 [Lentisphaerae bacterium GWF2_44_16]
MASIRDITDTKGRINYIQLRELVSNTSLSEFTSQAQYPFLIGKELYDGELRKKVGATTSTSTMKFDASEIRERIASLAEAKKASIANEPPAQPVSDTGGISHAIYLLRKKLYTKEDEQNVINIGRAEDNDIVIADFVISKHHAQIIIFHGMYFILDLNSTNGTRVNQQLISPKMKVQLAMNATIAFGRFCFVFTHPLQVYRAMRKEILGF